MSDLKIPERTKTGPHDEVAKIKDSLERLREAHGAKSVSLVQSCALSSTEPPHSGKCTSCKPPGKSHEIHLTEEAAVVAVDFFNQIKTGGPLNPEGDPKVDYKRLTETKGNMFGVLLCVDEKGQTQVLKSFSGRLDSTDVDDVKDYCPKVPCDKQSELNELYIKTGLAEQEVEDLKEKLAEKKKAKEDLQPRRRKRRSNPKRIGRSARYRSSRSLRRKGRRRKK